jgi:hypothetical protein
MMAATAGVAVVSPRFLGAAFDPVSLNLAFACLAVVDLLTGRDAPTAARARWRVRAPA